MGARLVSGGGSPLVPKKRVRASGSLYPLVTKQFVSHVVYRYRVVRSRGEAGHPQLNKRIEKKGAAHLKVHRSQKNLHQPEFMLRS